MTVIVLTGTVISHAGARGCDPSLATALSALSPFHSTLAKPLLLIVSGRFPLFVPLLLSVPFIRKCRAFAYFVARCFVVGSSP
jgi:hypothetical protein